MLIDRISLFFPTIAMRSIMYKTYIICLWLIFCFLPLASQADNIWITPEKMLSSTSGKMLFASERESSLSLFSKDFGTDKSTLIVKAAVAGRGEYEPSVSPDGKQIAFTTYRYGGWKIAVSDIDGNNIRRLTMDPQYAYDPHWSADGKKIVYRRIVNNGGAYFRGQADIFEINIDGTGNRNLSKTNNAGDRKPAYSPNGKKIVYDSFAGKEQEELWLMIMDADGKNLHRINSDVASDAMFAPSWSPDGEWVAHLRADTQNYIDVWIMRPNGAEAKNLTRSKERGLPPSNKLIRHWQFDTNWTKDGEVIAFVGNYLDQKNIDIYAVGFSGENLARLTKHSAIDLHPYWY